MVFLVGTLQNIARQMDLVAKQRQQVVKILTYPLVLIVFVVGVLFAMRFFLLPQLLSTGMVDPQHWGVRFIQWAPLGLLLLFIWLVGGLWLTQRRLRRQTPIQRAKCWSKLPLFGQLYTLMLTSYFSMEWGKLFQEGLELKQIVATMKETNSESVMYGLAIQLDEALSQGQLLSQKVAEYPFLTPEFARIVFQGEAKGRLGDELLLYSRLTLDRFYQRMDKLLHILQPLIFLLVGLLIVSVYAAMFLPIYGNMTNLLP